MLSSMTIRKFDISCWFSLMSIFLFQLEIGVGSSGINIILFIAILSIFIFIFEDGFKLSRSFLSAAFILMTYVFLQNIVISPNTLWFKHVVSIFVMACSSLVYVKYINKEDHGLKFFRKYLNVSYVVSVFSIVQLVTYYIGLRFIWDLSWLIDIYRAAYTGFGVPRFQSIFPEPAHFCLAMSPAIFVSLATILGVSNRFLSRPKACCVLFSAFLTFSSSAILCLFFSMVLLMKNFSAKKCVIAVVLVSVVLIGLYNNFDDFHDRIEPFLQVFNPSSFSISGNVNFSSLTIINNAYVAYSSFRDSTFLGSGLGSHPRSFESYSLLRELENVPSFNKEDGASLLIRLVSETGLLGIFFILYSSFILIKKYNSFSGDNFIIISSLIVYLILYVCRMGHYFAYGFWVVLFFSLNFQEKLHR